MEKAWEREWKQVRAEDELSSVVHDQKGHDMEETEDCGKPARKQIEELLDRSINDPPPPLKRWEGGPLDRAIHNSPPPLDDVGSDVTYMLDEKDPIAKLLSERAKTHGDFNVHAGVTQLLKAVMRDYRWYRLSDSKKEALDMIAHKIGRILAGDHNHVDHWDDIAGYAMLVSNQITSEVPPGS